MTEPADRLGIRDEEERQKINFTTHTESKLLGLKAPFALWRIRLSKYLFTACDH